VSSIQSPGNTQRHKPTHNFCLSGDARHNNRCGSSLLPAGVKRYSRNVRTSTLLTTLGVRWWGKGVKRRVVKRGSTAHSPTEVFYQFPKRPQWRKLECTPNTVNVSETGQTLPGRGRGEPSSDHAVPTAATALLASCLVTDKLSQIIQS